VPSPVLILCNARSGSTLLRYILDVHPAITAPPETSLGPLCSSVLAFAKDLPDEETRTATLGGGRALIDSALTRHARLRGKAIWCDKSVRTVEHLDAVRQVFPDARYLCLHRHAMDAIASGLEASRWGFGRYGYARYVRQQPDNTVAALAQYWIDRTSKILAVESAADCATLRVRYEDLVSRPHEVVTGILRFLGLPGEESTVALMITGALRARHDPGPGDFKIDFSSGVTAESVGRGRSVPVLALDRRQRRAMNALLGALGYEQVDDGWNDGARTAAPGPTVASTAQARESVAEAMSRVLGPRLRCLADGADEASPPLPSLSFDICYAGDSAERWVADPASGTVARLESGASAPPTYLVRAEVFLELAAGALSFSHAILTDMVLRSQPYSNQESDRLAERLLRRPGAT
jgi:Sulfotransferase family